jgi:transcriptional regulator with XRE-family HTH domain
MLFCMKATSDELATLRLRISAARGRKRLTNAEIGRLSNVDAGQVSRIVRGEFKTVSHNVVQVCKVLGLKIETVTTPSRRRDAAWAKLEASVRRLWDDSPQGAERIAAMLDTIAELRPQPKS